MNKPSEWICKSCTKNNNVNMDYCDKCGCPKTNKRYITKGWNQKLNTQKGPPTFSFIEAYMGPRTSPCPSCRLHMYITEVKCHHCGINLNSEERRKLISQYEKNQRYGRSLGFLFFPTILILLVALFFL